VLDLRKSASVTLAIVLLCTCVSPGFAQEAAADKAKALLRQGLEQFQAKQFKQAQATLMNSEADWDALAEAEKKQRDECLDKVGPAVKKQVAAEEALANATKALQGNQLAEAQKGFAIAAASEFLPDAKRKGAQEQLALVKQRMAAADTAQATPPDVPDNSAAVASAPASSADADAMLRRLESKGDPAPVNDDILTRINMRRQREKQAGEMKIAEAMKRANEILARAKGAADFDAAQAAVNVAENVLAASKGLYTPEEYRQRQTEIEQLGRYVAKLRANWEVRNATDMRRQLEQVERDRIKREERRLRTKVASLTADAQTLVKEKRYAEALVLMKQILRHEPDNQAAMEQMRLLEQVDLLRRERGYERDRSFETQRQMVDLRETEIPWYDLLRYPRDWREITLRREPFGAAAGMESEVNRAVMQRLQMKINEAKFEQIEFQTVIAWLRQVSGLNIHVNWGALEIAGIQPTVPVKNVHLTNVTVEKALRTVLEDVGGATPLSYVVDEGVVTVSTKEDLSGPRYRRTLVYDIRDLIVTVPSFNAPRIELNQAGTSGNNNNTGGGSIFGNNDTNNNQDATYMSRTEIVNAIIALIQATIDPTSWRGDAGGDIGSVQEMNGQLVVTQTAENHRALLNLLTQLREAKALQIAIEARFLSVSTGFLNSIGLDLNMYFNIGSNLGAFSILDPYTGAAVPTTWMPNSWVLAGEDAPGIRNLTPIGMRQDTTTFTNMIGRGSPISAGSSIGTMITNPSISVGGTFLEDIQVDFLLQATQAHESSRAMTAPRLTMFNGQRAYVTYAVQTAYVADITPVVSDNAIAFDPTISFVPTGTVLDVEATISADRRYVTMTVRPQIARLIRLLTFGTSYSSSDANGQLLEAVGVIQLPEVEIQDLQTTVSVPDGGTLLLGGQKSSGEVEREKGAPLLSKIPIINRAFTNRGKIRDETTSLLLIKPKIIIQREEEERAFPPQ